jgi:hypothetical protein
MKEDTDTQTQSLTVGMKDKDKTALTTAYNPLAEGLTSLLEKAKNVKVATVEDVDAMTEARKIRLDLRSIRVNVEKKRKELKDDVLLQGRAIDGFANIIKAKIIPVEKLLQDQEDFVEREQVRIAQELDNSRAVEIGAHTDTDYGVGVLGDMSAEVYGQLLSGAKIAKAQQVEAERKAESEKAERMEKEAKEKADLIAENKRLADAQKQADKKAKTERDKAEKIRKATQKKHDAEKAKAEKLRLETEAKAKKERDDAQALIDAEKAKVAKLQEQAKEDKRKKEKQEAEENARKLEEIENAKAAPDSDKLRAFYKVICSIEIPTVESEIAHCVMGEVRQHLNDVCKSVKSGVVELTKTGAK